MATAVKDKFECLVCGKSMPDLLSIKTDKTRNQSLLQEIVFQILDRKRVENVISLFLCRICSNLLSDFEELENRAKHIKTEVSQRVYRRLAPSFSGQNLEPGELEDLNDFIEDNIKVFEINVALKQEEIKQEFDGAKPLHQDSKQMKFKSLHLKKKQEYENSIALSTKHINQSRTQGKRQIKSNLRYVGELSESEDGDKDDPMEEDMDTFCIELEGKEWRSVFPDITSQMGDGWRIILSSKIQERHPGCLLYFPSFSYSRDRLYIDNVLLDNEGMCRQINKQTNRQNIAEPYFEATGLCHIENCDAIFKIKCTKLNRIDVTLTGKVENRIINHNMDIKDGDYDTNSKEDNARKLSKLYTMSKSDYEMANICQFCLDCFLSKEQYLEHMSNSHKGVQDYMFSCHGCEMGFTTASLRNTHFKSVHIEPSFECKKCNKKFLVEAKLKVHQKTCVHGVRHTCSQCNKTFINERNLRDHTLVFHEKMQNETSSKYHFPCTECHKIFYKKSNLQSHMLRHSDSTPFRCSIQDCGKGFKREKTLLKHIQLIHEGIKEEYLCGTCGQQFGSQSGLKTHQARHIGEEYIKRLIYCQICNKSFRCPADLKVHSVVHSKNKPFACDLCGQSFSQKASLKDHKNVHLNLYQCGGCDKSFGRERYLKQHQRTCAQFLGNSKMPSEEGKIVQFFSGDQMIMNHHDHEMITDAEILAADGTSTGTQVQVLRSASGEVTVLQADNVAVDEASGNLVITDAPRRQEVIVTESPSGQFLVSETPESRGMSEASEQGLVMSQEVGRKQDVIVTETSMVVADEGQLVVTDTVQEIMVTVENENICPEGNDLQRPRLIVAEGPGIAQDSDAETEDSLGPTRGQMLVVAHNDSYRQHREESLVTQRMLVNDGKMFKPIRDGRLVMTDETFRHTEDSLDSNKVFTNSSSHNFEYGASEGSSEPDSKRRLLITGGEPFKQKEQTQDTNNRQRFVMPNGAVFRMMTEKGERVAVMPGGPFVMTSAGRTELLVREGQSIGEVRELSEKEARILEPAGYESTVEVVKKGSEVINQSSELY